MPFQKIAILLLSAALLFLARHFYGWGGIAVALGGLVMWSLLHFTRMVQVLKRAGKRPIGYIDSAVMLNAKLRPGMPLLHVVAMTRSLGAPRSADGQQPESYCWSDAGGSDLHCDFHGGKLKRWQLLRPPPPSP